MRVAFSIVYFFLILALSSCAFISYRSQARIGKSVALLDAALIPPVMGNLIIICSNVKTVSMIGCYIYFIGMDLMILALYRFTLDYCRISQRYRKTQWFVYALLAIDTMQLLLNPVFGHAFDTSSVSVYGKPYYRLQPFAGQMFHRIVVYLIFAIVLLVFIVRTVRSLHTYAHQYSVILLAMLITGIWQTFYIFSRTPVDRSMIGFGVFGLLVCYFTQYYRPLRLLDRLLSDIVSDLPEALFVYDPTGKCIWANKPACELIGIDRKSIDLVSERLTSMFGPADIIHGDWNVQRTLGTGDDKKYYVIENRTVTDERSHAAGSYVRIRDNTKEQLRLKKEMYDATHDNLTGFYTQAYLYKQIQDTLRAHPNTEYLIVFVDVKNFKIVNDIFSNAFGDFALRCIADLIRSHTSENCVYGRLAGAAFGVCVPAMEFNAQFLEETLARFVVNDNSVSYHILIHLGVYAAASADMDVAVMFDRAHLALSTIRDEYQTHIAYYNQEIREKVLWNQKISAQLHDALANMQIRPYLQPIADRNGKIVGAEALARWIHPDHGFMSPAAFIPFFEKNGMIVEVDKHMWRCSCEILARWKKEHRDQFISVNISPKDFYFIDVISEIKQLVHEFGIEPDKLRIEITETVMMNDADERMQILNDFREAGFIVEMDDFGSGYSSLNLLKDMPVDVLKIDMKFLGKTKDHNKAQTIVKNIINLSRDLGISSLTEGVETEIQYHILSEMGCKLFQGYYFAKPMPVEEFEAFVKP